MVKRYTGGIISATPPTVAANSTGVFAGIAQAIQYVQTGAFPRLPDPPTNIIAAQGNGRAIVSFNIPNSGGSPILYYIVTSNPGNITAIGTSSPITITGLTNGTSYTFTVTAVSSLGPSSASSISNSVSPSNLVSVDILLVAGGGGGGKAGGGGGGGGAGGMIYHSDVQLASANTYTITVGAGGAAGTAGYVSLNTPTAAQNGGNSSISGAPLTALVAVGGGAGSSAFSGTSYAQAGNPGGSGGGGAQRTPAPGGNAVSGQGNPGGSAFGPGGDNGGGGGGAGSAGGDGTAPTAGGTGGNGRANSITGVSVTYAGGGGGGGGSAQPVAPSQAPGGGGRGGSGSTPAGNGNVNLGGGGGGNGALPTSAGAGGSGVVIIRYLASLGAANTTGSVQSTEISSNTYKVYTFTGSGTIQFD